MHISARLTINVQQPEERIEEMISLAEEMVATIQLLCQRCAL